MRKKINRKTYDTDTATFICDTNSIRGKLYRRYHSNDYFLLSRNGLVIEPVDWMTAKELAYRNAPRQLYLKHFTSEVNETGRAVIDIDKSDLNKLRIIAGVKQRTNIGTLHDIINTEYRKLNRHISHS